MEVPRLGVESELKQCWIQVVSVICTTAHGHAESLTHWALLWLWHRLEATAPIRPLAICQGSGPRKGKMKKKKKKKCCCKCVHPLTWRMSQSVPSSAQLGDFSLIHFSSAWTTLGGFCLFFVFLGCTHGMWTFPGYTGPIRAAAAHVYHSSWQHWILNSLNKARDQTWVLMNPSRICYHWATVGTPTTLCFI